MIKVTNELVHVFWEDGEPVGLLYQNGHREFYKVNRASKEHVNHLLNSDRAEEAKEDEKS